MEVHVGRTTDSTRWPAQSAGDSNPAIALLAARDSNSYMHIVGIWISSAATQTVTIQQKVGSAEASTLIGPIAVTASIPTFIQFPHSIRSTKGAGLLTLGSASDAVTVLIFGRDDVS